jgi:hypothetical protein
MLRFASLILVAVLVLGLVLAGGGGPADAQQKFITIGTAA